MNKKLLAIAVGAAMVAGATAATAGDEPTWYGKIHMSIDSMDNDGTAPNDVDGIFVSSNSSRLGLKGKVALDGGMNAVYKYEMSTDYTGALAGNRNAYMGLNSGGHTVIAGRHDMPFKTVGRKFDLFGDTIGDTRAVTRLGKSNIDLTLLGATFDSSDDWADRRNNVIMYTGKFDAVAVKVAYAPEEGKDDSTDMGIGITYKGGPIKVMFANETHGKGNLIGATKNGSKDSSGNTIAGSYKMGNMKFLAGYSAISEVDGIDGLDYNAWTIGGAMKSGKNTFKLQYTSGEFDASGLTDAASTLIAVGADHNFSKKTKVYVVYAALANDDNTAMSLNGTGHAATVGATTALGDSPSGFSVGMIHKF